MENGSRLSAVPGDSDRLAARVTALASSTEALCAVVAALKLKGSDLRAAPAVEAALAEVVGALGLSELVANLGAADSRVLASIIQSRIQQASSLALDPTSRPGSESMAELVESHGFTSDTLAQMLRTAVFPLMPGLLGRLEASRTTSLVKGVAAGGLAIAMCRMWPALSCVGVDTSEAVVALARPRVEEAGLADRIELRVQDLAQLPERDAFDLVWLPASFTGASLLAALRRVRRATRPRGWIVLNGFGGSDELSVALARLRTARAGGTEIAPQEAPELLVASGWKDARLVPRGILPSLWLAVGRCPAS